MYELGVVHRTIHRADAAATRALAEHGVATVHEAQGKVGLLGHELSPIYAGATVAGTAVTVLLQPGDNWMLHVAAEQIQPGDLVVAGVTAPCTDGYFGELLAESFRSRGAVGLVIDAGVRDVKALTEMDFPVWSRCISAKGTIKATLGSVNVPVVCAGQVIHPGDAVVADDDGVVCVPATTVPKVTDAARKRTDSEAERRKLFADGVLGLDFYDMREALAAKGLRYLD